MRIALKIISNLFRNEIHFSHRVLSSSITIMINKRVILRGISKAKYMHYANNIVMYDEIGLDFLRELFSRTTRSVYFKVSDERVRN